MKIKTTIAALLLCQTIIAAKPHKYRLVWQDNFKGTTFDKRSWTKIPRGSADWNRHMSDADSLYAVKDGKLTLRGVNNRTEKQDTARFITGGLYTKGQAHHWLRQGGSARKAKLRTRGMACHMDAAKQRHMA